MVPVFAIALVSIAPAILLDGAFFARGAAFFFAFLTGFVARFFACFADFSPVFLAGLFFDPLVLLFFAAFAILLSC